jgi:5-methylcytosine-specific restriction endonuclease McrBC regulatory subunit McrC
MRTTDNNGGKSLRDIEGKNTADLSEIANKNLIDLQNENQGLLVYPSVLGQFQDDIQKSHIFSLYGDTLTTYNIMGFIGRNDTDMRIFSRFEQKSRKDYFLHYMLGKVLSLNIVNLDTSKGSDGIEDFLPYLFPSFLKKALSQGVFKQYQRKQYNNANIRGVADVARHIRMNYPFAGKIAYNTREYSYDNIITQIIRHTIEFLRSSRMFCPILTAEAELRSDIQKVIDCTPLYDKNDRQKLVNKNRNSIRHPYFTEYLPLQKLCLQILKYEKISFGDDKDKIHGLVFDGAWLWEEYLNTLLKGIFTHPRNKTKENRHYLFSDEKGKNRQEIYPDFIKKDKSIIADAKYKHLEIKNGEYGRDDYFQLISYMYRFGSEHGYLLFPHENKHFCETYTINGTNGKLTRLGLLIPQGKETYEEFCKEIKDNERIFMETLVFNIPVSDM